MVDTRSFSFVVRLIMGGTPTFSFVGLTGVTMVDPHILSLPRFYLSVSCVSHDDVHLSSNRRTIKSSSICVHITGELHRVHITGGLQEEWRLLGEKDMLWVLLYVHDMALVLHNPYQPQHIITVLLLLLEMGLTVCIEIAVISAS